MGAAHVSGDPALDGAAAEQVQWNDTRVLDEVEQVDDTAEARGGFRQRAVVWVADQIHLYNYVLNNYCYLNELEL